MLLRRQTCAHLVSYGSWKREKNVRISLIFLFFENKPEGFYREVYACRPHFRKTDFTSIIYSLFLVFFIFKKSQILTHFSAVYSLAWITIHHKTNKQLIEYIDIFWTWCCLCLFYFYSCSLHGSVWNNCFPKTNIVNFFYSSSS